MPISGLVVTLSSDNQLRQEALDALSSHPAFELGPERGNRISLVLDTPDSPTDRQTWEWLQSLAGILQVEIAVIHFEEEDEEMEEMDDDAVDNVTHASGGSSERAGPPCIPSVGRGDEPRCEAPS